MHSSWAPPRTQDFRRSDATQRAVIAGERCGLPRSVTADASGAASVTVTAGERCSRCGIRVTGAGARDVFVPVRFVAPPGVTYDAAQVALGLGAAALLLLVAGFIVRRTDWRPPTEAATPEMDAVAW